MGLQSNISFTRFPTCLSSYFVPPKSLGGALLITNLSCAMSIGFAFSLEIGNLSSYCATDCFFTHVVHSVTHVVHSVMCPSCRRFGFLALLAHSGLKLAQWRSGCQCISISIAKHSMCGLIAAVGVAVRHRQQLELPHLSASPFAATFVVRASTAFFCRIRHCFGPFGGQRLLVLLVCGSLSYLCLSTCHLLSFTSIFLRHLDCLEVTLEARCRRNAHNSNSKQGLSFNLRTQPSS